MEAEGSKESPKADKPQTVENKPKANGPQAATGKPVVNKSKKAGKKKPVTPPVTRKRTVRAYPAASFEDSLQLAQEIVKHAPDGKIRRLTFCKLANRSATSSSTQMLITNSGKYGITKGSYVAEYLEITPTGMTAVAAQDSKDRAKSRYSLAIEGIAPFKALNEEYLGKRIPSREVMRDFMANVLTDADSISECLDLFIVNVKFLGLLQTIGGSETLVPLSHVLDELPSAPAGPTKANESTATSNLPNSADDGAQPAGGTDWSKVCFYISPIGSDESEQRSHSDLFLHHLVEPALEEFDLKVVRADQIGESGMITSQILEHILKAKLVVVDLSFLNPNVFYELAIRHACKLPIVQIIRKSDRIPFDVDQIRTIQIDNSGIYALIPKLLTYRSEIATHVRQALANNNVSNPLTLFSPGFHISFPK